MRSSIANKRPAPATLLEGQAAVNLNATEPGLFFKLSSGVLTKIGPVAVSTGGAAPNSAPAGSSGNATGEEWLDARAAFSSPVLKVYDGGAWRPSSGFTVSDTTGDFSLAKGVTVRNLISNGTGANSYVKLNVGPTTDQTSITAASGMIRYDSTTNEFVGYYGGGSAGWRIIGPAVSPAGDGQINVNAGTGITITGDNATANQTGNTTRTVTLDTTYADGRYVLKTGSTMTGLLTLSGDPTANLMAATKQYVDNNTPGAPGNGQINVAAGTGLSASGTQATANQAGNTTRTLELDLTYSDGRYVKKIGDMMTGLLILSGNPTANLGAATKQYVDGLITSPGNGQINVNPGTGLSVTGTNATANQTGNTTRTLSLDLTYSDARYVKITGSDMTGNLTLGTNKVILNASTGVSSFAGDVSVTSTGAITIPDGTTAQRPGSPGVGAQRFNTTSGNEEIYTGSALGWRDLAYASTTTALPANVTIATGTQALPLYTVCNNFTVASGANISAAANSSGSIVYAYGNVVINASTFNYTGIGGQGISTFPTQPSVPVSGGGYAPGIGVDGGRAYSPQASLGGSSGGGGGSTTGGNAATGGNGGGYLIIRCLGTFTVNGTVVITANGSDSVVNGNGGSGGAGGGAGIINFHSGKTMTIPSSVTFNVKGGAAAFGPTAIQGCGGGGGGWVILEAPSLSDSSTKNLAGGAAANGGGTPSQPGQGGGASAGAGGDGGQTTGAAGSPGGTGIFATTGSLL